MERGERFHLCDRASASPPFHFPQTEAAWCNSGAALASHAASRACFRGGIPHWYRTHVRSHEQSGEQRFDMDAHVGPVWFGLADFKTRTHLTISAHRVEASSQCRGSICDVHSDAFHGFVTCTVTRFMTATEAPSASTAEEAHSAFGVPKRHLLGRKKDRLLMYPCFDMVLLVGL